MCIRDRGIPCVRKQCVSGWGLEHSGAHLQSAVIAHSESLRLQPGHPQNFVTQLALLPTRRSRMNRNVCVNRFTSRHPKERNAGSLLAKKKNPGSQTRGVSPDHWISYSYLPGTAARWLRFTPAIRVHRVSWSCLSGTVYAASRSHAHSLSLAYTNSNAAKVQFHFRTTLKRCVLGLSLIHI